MVGLWLVLAGCASGDDDASVTTADLGSVRPESTTTTGPIETTTTTVVETTTTTRATTTTSAAANLISVSVAGGEVSVEGAVSVTAGTEITIRVASDVPDEVHVHTFDLFAEVTPETPAEIRFTPDVPGVHEVELEGAGLRLFDLEVT